MALTSLLDCSEARTLTNHDSKKNSDLLKKLTEILDQSDEGDEDLDAKWLALLESKLIHHWIVNDTDVVSLEF